MPTPTPTPWEAVQLLDQLVALGLSDRHFRLLHHAGDDIRGYYNYCKYTVQTFNDSENKRVCHRLRRLLTLIREEHGSDAPSPEALLGICQTVAREIPIK